MAADIRDVDPAELRLSGTVLARLAQLKALCPELRFGQLIATIGMLAEDETGHSLWDVDDADFAAVLERFTVDLARRGSDRAGAV